jgi:hypothetical protein
LADEVGLGKTIEAVRMIKKKCCLLNGGVVKRRRYLEVSVGSTTMTEISIYQMNQGTK